MTLIELLLAAMMGLVVVGGAMTVFLGAVRSEPRTAAQVDAIQGARVTVDRITRELRQGREIPISEPDQLAVITYVKAESCGGAPAGTAIPCLVTYSCGGDTCNRVVAQPNGSAPGPSVQVADGLASPNVFTYVPPDPSDPEYVGVELELEADGGGSVTLGDGVALRNLEGEET